MMILCIGINVTGGILARFLNLPFWLDTVGTIAAAVAFGPVAGGLVGLISGLCSGNLSGYSLFYLPIGILVGVMIGALYPRKTKKEAVTKHF
jgi:energy-coupling factor transport system substrate-specific component